MNRLLPVIAATCFVSIGASGAIFTTFEAAGAQQTTQSDVIVETFDGAPLGSFSGASAIGTFSNGGQLVKNSDIYGGSTKYLDIGLYATGSVTPGVPPLSYEVQFGGAIDYFGFYWAAADYDDKVEFYNGAVVVGTFTSALFAGINPAYYIVNGAENPPTTTEPYAFVNFFGTGGTTFDRVVFTNGTSGTGFETDNYTIGEDGTTRTFDLPEPATFGIMGTSLALMALGFRKRRS